MNVQKYATDLSLFLAINIILKGDCMNYKIKSKLFFNCVRTKIKGVLVVRDYMHFKVSSHLLKFLKSYRDRNQRGK
jgi:hypothetical protein